MLRVIGWLIRKDLSLFFADRGGALMTFALPVLLASLVGMLFAPRAAVGEVRLLVVDEDGGEVARGLVAALDGEAAIAVERVALAEARRRLERGEAGVALVLARGAGAATLLYDPSRHIEVELANGLLERVQLVAAVRALAPADAPRALDVRREAVVAAGPAAGYDSYAHNFAGMLCMFLLFLAQDLAKGLLAERRTGALVRTRLAAPRPLVPLVAMLGSTTLLGLVMTACVFGVAVVVFGVELRGGLVAFGAVALGYALFAGAFAVLLAGLARSEKQVTAIGTAVILLSSFVGGAWYPRFMMPDWLQAISQALPTTWATEGFAAATWRGLPLTEALLPAAALAGVAALLVALGTWRFRWEGA